MRYVLVAEIEEILRSHGWRPAENQTLLRYINRCTILA